MTELRDNYEFLHYFCESCSLLRVMVDLEPLSNQELDSESVEQEEQQIDDNDYQQGEDRMAHEPGQYMSEYEGGSL